MQKLVKIMPSPSSPNIEVVDKMVMKVSGSYSEESVTIQFNPNIQYYKKQQDQKNIKVRQIMVTTPTNETKTITFDFETNNVHDVTIENTKYNIKLMRIGKEPLQGQNFLYFEFFVTWD